MKKAATFLRISGSSRTLFYGAKPRSPTISSHVVCRYIKQPQSDGSSVPQFNGRFPTKNGLKLRITGRLVSCRR